MQCFFLKRPIKSCAKYNIWFDWSLKFNYQCTSYKLLIHSMHHMTEPLPRKPRYGFCSCQPANMLHIFVSYISNKYRQHYDYRQLLLRPLKTKTNKVNIGFAEERFWHINYTYWAFKVVEHPDTSSRIMLALLVMRLCDKPKGLLLLPCTH